jgi:hypothetical protein
MTLRLLVNNSQISQEYAPSSSGSKQFLHREQINTKNLEEKLSDQKYQLYLKKEKQTIRQYG